MAVSKTRLKGPTDGSSSPPPATAPEGGGTPSPSAERYPHLIPSPSQMQPGSERKQVLASPQAADPSPEPPTTPLKRVFSGQSGGPPATPQPSVCLDQEGEARTGLVAEAPEPYCLRAVGHSLGGANLLIHCLARRASRRPCHVHRLVLMTPAGFHVQMPPVRRTVAAPLRCGLLGVPRVPRPFRPFPPPLTGQVLSNMVDITSPSNRAERVSVKSSQALPAGHSYLWLSLSVQVVVPVYFLLPGFVRLMRLFWPRFAMPLFIPTSTVRRVVFKLFRDVSGIPALLELLKLGIRLVLNNDASQWERAMQMPHYNADDMPSLSVYQGERW